MGTQAKKSPSETLLNFDVLVLDVDTGSDECPNASRAFVRIYRDDVVAMLKASEFIQENGHYCVTRFDESAEWLSSDIDEAGEPKPDEFIDDSNLAVLKAPSAKTFMQRFDGPDFSARVDVKCMSVTGRNVYWSCQPKEGNCTYETTHVSLADLCAHFGIEIPQHLRPAAPVI